MDARRSATALRAYAGSYVGDAVDATLHVSVRGDRAMIAARGLPPTELQPETAPDTFRFSIYVARFGRDAPRAAYAPDAGRVARDRHALHAPPRTVVGGAPVSTIVVAVNAPLLRLVRLWRARRGHVAAVASARSRHSE